MVLWLLSTTLTVRCYMKYLHVATAFPDMLPSQGMNGCYYLNRLESFFWPPACGVGSMISSAATLAASMCMCCSRLRCTVCRLPARSEMRLFASRCLHAMASCVHHSMDLGSACREPWCRNALLLLMSGNLMLCG